VVNATASSIPAIADSFVQLLRMGIAPVIDGLAKLIPIDSVPKVLKNILKTIKDAAQYPVKTILNAVGKFIREAIDYVLSGLKLSGTPALVRPIEYKPEKTVWLDPEGIPKMSASASQEVKTFLDGLPPSPQKTDAVAKESAARQAGISASNATKAQQSPSSVKVTAKKIAAAKTALQDLAYALAALPEGCSCQGSACPISSGASAQAASGSNPCPAQNDHYSCISRTVTVPWFADPIEMSDGGAAFVVKSADRTNLRTPPWWGTFLTTQPYNAASWEKGHIIASRFSGSRDHCNFSAQYEYVNQSIFRVCENRIAAALGCGCIRVIVTPQFGSDPVVPERFTIVATGLGGNGYRLNVSFRNLPNEPVPQDCLL